MEFFNRHISSGYRSYWQVPLDSVQQMLQELVDYASRWRAREKSWGSAYVPRRLRACLMTLCGDP